ncbi:MAG: GAF domain-containing protein, partial [Polyangiaceae bacterium]|nr:GAF domain-containing protein [Polyangiaceae bacterium]
MSIASPNSTGSPSVKCQTPAAGSSKMLPPDVDWSRTLLDPEERWPKSLQAAADLVLSSLQPMIILWGPDLIAVYNNACRPLLGPMHPAAFGQKLRDAWPELWKTAGSALEGAFAGSPAWLRDVELTARKGDRSEHVHADVFASPLRDETGSTAGVLFALSETTSRVLAERRYSERMRQLADAAVAINSTLSIEEMLQRVTEHARQLIGAHQAVISLTINQNWAQSVSAVSLSEKYAEWRSYSEASDGSGIYSLICRHNKPMRLTQAELTSHPAWKGFGKSASKHPPMRGWLAAPLTGRDGGNLGLLQLSDKYEGDFTESDEAIAVQLAQMASVAVENAGLLQETEAARKTAEAERRDAERLNRLKDEFLATVSHELRTPLQAILGWSRLLRGGQADSSRLAKGLEVIDRNAKVQAQLIEDILDVSRIIAGKVRINDATVNIASVVRAAIDTTRPAADAKRIELTAEIDPEIGVIAGDEDRLQQVVWNLLTNAVKFTPSGGRVSVRAARVGTQVEITVADSGAGIAAEFLPHVFERFRQADATTTRAHGGLGLGLAIVRHLVEMHGGTVRAESDG